jgi:hypothetical protein
MYSLKLGIGLISYDRPHYFKQVIESLEKQTYLQNTDFHLFQDGAKNKFSGRCGAYRRNIKSCIDVFTNSKLPNKGYHINKLNVGNAINQFEAVEYLSKKYDYFMIIEDDVILSTNYLRMIRILIEQYLLEDNNIFSLGLSFTRLCKLQDINQNLNKVKLQNMHWWAECWRSKNWLKIKPYFIQYYNLVKAVDYMRRDPFIIKRFFHSHGFNIPQTSQDAGKDFALFKTGLKRLTTVVNRGFYIGEVGMHFRPQTYKRFRLGEQKPFEFESDKIIDRFELI